MLLQLLMQICCRKLTHTCALVAISVLVALSSYTLEKPHLSKTPFLRTPETALKPCIYIYINNMCIYIYTHRFLCKNPGTLLNPNISLGFMAVHSSSAKQEPSGFLGLTSGRARRISTSFFTAEPVPIVATPVGRAQHWMSRRARHQSLLS